MRAEIYSCKIIKFYIFTVSEKFMFFQIQSYFWKVKHCRHFRSKHLLKGNDVVVIVNSKNEIKNRINRNGAKNVSQ
jgi:hypothetical protein